MIKGKKSLNRLWLTVPSDSIAGPQRKKALLSIADGRASSFFLYFFKDYNTATFFTCSGFSGAKIRRKTEKIGEFKRKSEKNGELSVNFRAYL